MSAFTINFERTYFPQKALLFFNEELKKLNLYCKLSFIGHRPQTTRCWLYHLESHSIADVGNGKGIGLQSEISAKYEALEHYVSTQESFLKSQLLWLSFEKIKSELSQENKDILPVNFKNKHKTAKTVWLSLSKFAGNSSILLPYFLINPDYRNRKFLHDQLDYTTFKEISTNNGIAIGTTFDEALLHATNELIERDAVSCFLLATFGKKTPKPIMLVDKTSLPNFLSELITNIEKSYCEELLIVDITTDLEFPTFLVSFTKQPQSIQPMGFGASLSALYALERAILESVQSLHLYDKALKLADSEILENFNFWPKLYQCAECNVNLIVKTGLFQLIKFQDIDPPSRISDALASTVKILERKKFSLYFTSLYTSESGITCVKAVIPGIEQFHRVRYGSFAIPGKRGRAVLLTS